MKVPFDCASLDGKSEYFLNLEFRLKEDKPWADAGYVQMAEQLMVALTSSRCSLRISVEKVS